MKASIILCTHRSERYEDFIEAINSLKAQSYTNLEIVVVVDGNRELYDRILKSGIEGADKVDVKVILNEKNLGLSESQGISFMERRRKGCGGFIEPEMVNRNSW